MQTMNHGPDRVGPYTLNGDIGTLTHPSPEGCMRGFFCER